MIDLKLAAVQSDWRRRGFLDKLFHASEIRRIRDSEHPEHTVWLFWAFKESAYKIWNRETGLRSFNPLAFQCDGKQEVRMGTRRFYLKWSANPESIHAVAVRDASNLDHIREITPSDLIKKDGYPFVAGYNRLIPASLSHHGRFEKAVFLDLA